MNTVPNHGFIEVHSMHPHHQHQHQPHCKQQCFVFTEIADIVELPPEITKIGSEKMQNGGISPYTKDPCGSSGGMDSPTESEIKKSRSKRILIVLGIMLTCIAMAGGIPLALQLRQSSLLEARLAFIRRLLSEAPLIEGSWTPTREQNFSSSMHQMRQKYVGAVLWPIAVPCGAQYLDAVQLALEGIDEAKRITAVTDSMHIVESADEMEQTHIRGEVAVLMGLGGGHALGTSLAVLRSMYLLGARFVSITSLECTTPWAASTKNLDYLVEGNGTNSINDFGKVQNSNTFK